jgi:hypothetical protein
MEPAVQGAIIGASAALLGVISSGVIQWALKISEESRRKQEAAELTIFHCRRLRRVFQELSEEQSLTTHLALGISINDDDIYDLEYILKELSTKIPQLNLRIFDIRRLLKNVQSYSKQYWDLLDSIKKGTGNLKDLQVIEALIRIDAGKGNSEAHETIQLAFKQLSASRKKSLVHKISLDKAYYSK